MRGAFFIVAPCGHVPEMFGVTWRVGGLASNDSAGFDEFFVVVCWEKKGEKDAMRLP